MKKTRRATVGLLSVILIMAVSHTQAALEKFSGEFPLLGDISGHQKNPNVVLGHSGGFVVWQNMASNGQFEQVKIQRLGSDMTGVGGSARLSQGNSQGNELNPRVAVLSVGGAAAVWESGPRANTDIYLRILNSGGSFVTGALSANTYTDGNQRDADVTVLTNGNVVVVWSSEGQDGDGSGVYGQLFTSGGARIGGEFQVNGVASMNQSDPAVAAMGDGSFVVAWVSETAVGRTGAGAPNLRGNIMGRVFGASGNAQGNEYRLNDGDTLASTPVLVASDEGGFLAAWTQRDEEITLNMSDIYIRSFNSSGVPKTKSARHNTHLKGQQIKPELVQLAGDALVAWTSYGQDASGAGVQGRLASGGTEFQVNSQGQLHQSAPTVATDGENKFLVVWVNTINPSHSVLSAQRFVTSNSALAGVVDADVTSGEVQVVSADSQSRLTRVAAVQPAVTESAPTVQITSPSIPAPSVPVAPTPAPTPVSAKSAPAVQSTPAASAPRSLASARANMSTAASRQMPRGRSFAQQRSSANAGLSMMQRMAQNRSLGRPSPGYGGRATQMARAPQSRSGQFGGPGRSLPSQGMRTGMRSSQGGVRNGSLASSRANPARRTASSALRGLNRSGGGSGPGSAARSNPAQSRTIKADLQRGAGGGYNLSWQSQAGRRYVVQGSNDLKKWNNVGAARSGRGGQDSVQVGGRNAPRYYRVTQAN